MCKQHTGFIHEQAVKRDHILLSALAISSLSVWTPLQCPAPWLGVIPKTNCFLLSSTPSPFSYPGIIWLFISQCRLAVSTIRLSHSLFLVRSPSSWAELLASDYRNKTTGWRWCIPLNPVLPRIVPIDWCRRMFPLHISSLWSTVMWRGASASFRTGNIARSQSQAGANTLSGTTTTTSEV